MKGGPKSSLRPFLHQALQLFACLSVCLSVYLSASLIVSIHILKLPVTRTLHVPLTVS